MAVSEFVIPSPTLSTHGWVTDSANKMDFLLSHFFLSDYNQTYFYKGRVSSLPRVIEKNGGKVNGVTEELKSVLSSYLNRYYDSVDVEVSIVDEDTNLTSSATVQLKIGITDKGSQRVFGRLLSSTDGKLQTVAKINNFS